MAFARHALADSTYKKHFSLDGADPDRCTRPDVLDALDEIACEARLCVEMTSRVDANTLMQVDQFSDLKNEIFHLRSILMAIGVSQLTLLCLMLWRMW